ncbi:26S protease regulatory subunit [Methanogenium sp. MK-MG]|uniref:ATP-binding protein n=1 Tax=Methanogenium sp. MK-MG TaxID=2599926 RepID=UPI0013EB7A50|nr:ATP-binding protein [Methanogenium sp. MK-MG]KAF1078117.1 ATP-dependent zinc metalloprotease FtsH [Methanogenium sp. MK-MG]
MTVDLSGFLATELKKTIQEFQTARGKNDNATVREKAHACAVLSRQLAEQMPSLRKKYLSDAERWGAIASGEIPVSAEKRGSSSAHNSRQTSGQKPGVKPRQNPENRVSPDETDGSFDASSLISSSSVRWDDIGGLDEVKRLVKETVVISGLKKPDAIRPWKGILLFGPPGTGKTMIAAAAAGSLHATFYDVKADRVLSKYFGESSKLVASLYDSARSEAPSIVFIDEFDALGSARGEGTSEATRKLLSSLLTEMDGLQDKKADRLLLTMAATNTPWDLDPAVLSRFPRRIYVTLPDAVSCEAIIRLHTVGLGTVQLDAAALAECCVEQLYSGRDVQNLCQQAIWTMIHEENPRMDELADLPFDELKERVLLTRDLCATDFDEAFEKIRSPVRKEDLERYMNWNNEYGEAGF